MKDFVMKNFIVACLLLAQAFSFRRTSPQQIHRFAPSPQNAIQEQTIYLPVLFRDFDSVWNWSGTASITLDPFPANDPITAIDDQGRLHVFWDAWPGSGQQFIYHLYQTPSGWSSPAPVANTLGSSKVVIPPVIDSAGRLHLLWYNSLIFGGPYRLMYAYFDGQNWSPEEELFQWDSIYIDGRLSVDPQGQAHVLIRADGIISSYFYHRVRTASGWIGPENITPTLEGTWAIWEAFPDASGGVRFYGTSFYTDSQYFSYWKDGQFQIQGRTFEGVLRDRNMQLDSSDNLHLYRTASVPIPGGNVDGLFYQCLDAGLNWGSEKTLSGQESIGNGIQPAWSGAESLAFAWKLYNSKKINIAIVQGCRDNLYQTTRTLQPTALSDRLGDIASLALSRNSKKLCALLDIPYYSHNYAVVCASRY